MRERVTSTMTFWPRKTYRRRFSLRLVILLMSFFALSLPTVGYAQKLGGRVKIPGNFNKAPAIPPVDYFLRDVNPHVKNDIFQRERYHMGKSFWTAVREGRLQPALDDLDFVLRYIPNHPKALTIVGFISRSGGNPTIANLYYQRALRRYPHRALTHAQYGAYLADIGKVNEGVARLQKAIVIDPNLVSAHLWLARVYARAGKKELARQAAQRANEARVARPAPESAQTLDTESLPATENETAPVAPPQEGASQ